MASKTIRTLAETLENLSKRNFEDFCFTLLDREEEPRVRRSSVEGRSRLEVAEELVSTFTEAGAVQVAVEILREIDCNEDAELLAARPSAGARPFDTTADDFFLRHRVQLIQRVSNIQLILDDLLDRRVLSDEEYEKISALPTSQEKMRLLLYSCQSKGSAVENILYRILEMHEPFLIADFKVEEKRKYENVIDTVETMTTKKVLTETLNDLSSEELQEFKSLIEYEKDFPSISRSRLKAANKADIVELLVETNSAECVELTKRVLKKMKRTDLEQRLSDICPGTKEKQQPPLIQRVEAMASVIELLLETLKDLTDRELKEFKDDLQRQILFDRRFSDFSCSLPQTADRQDMVFSLVLTYGQQSVETTRNALRKMNRIDLVQKLSDSSSGPKKKHSLDEHLSALIHKVATMAAVKELLSETLSDLSSVEFQTFKWLLQFTFFQRSLPLMSLAEQLDLRGAGQLVDVMVDKCCQQSVEVVKEVFMNMNRTDLVQRLPETSSGHEAAGSSAEDFVVKTAEGEKHSLDEHWPALIQKVDTMASVIELLLETLAALREDELENFKLILSQETDLTERISSSSLMLLEIMHMQDMVFLLVQTEGQQSVETTKKVLKKMKRTDLVQRLSDRSSPPKEKHSDEHRPALIQGVATMSAVKQLLLETLNDLSDKDLEKFEWILEETAKWKELPFTMSSIRLTREREGLVDQMLENFGQRSIDLTREAVRKMNRIDLMQRLSEPSSGLKEKPSVDEHRPAVMKRAAVKHVLWKSLKDFSQEEFEKFKYLLQFTYFQKGLPRISLRRLYWAESAGELVDVMVENQQPMEVTKEVFMDMNRPDLVERLSETSSGLKDKQQLPLIQRVEAMASVIELLLETLKDLTDWELKEFKNVFQHQNPFHRRFSDFSLSLPQTADRQVMVFSLVLTYGQQSVETTTNVLRKMNRIDLVQKLSDSSSGPKKKHSLDEHLSALIHKVATMAAVKELLSETLSDLSYEELQTFKWLLQFTFFQRSLPLFSQRQLPVESEVEDLVDLMVDKCGQQSVEVMKEVFMNMNRTDLVQRLPETSSGHEAAGSSAEDFGVNTAEGDKHHVDEHWPALIQKVDTMASVIELLLETLAALREDELENFQLVLSQETDFTECISSSSLMLLEIMHMQDMVFLLVQTEGQQSVETTKKVLKKMERTDLVQRLSDRSSPPKEKHLDGHRPAMIQRVATMSAVKQLLLETLNDLSDEELKKFMRILIETASQKKLPVSMSSKRAEFVDLMVQTYGKQSFDLTMEVVKKMKRNDLMQRLSEPSSGLKENPSVDEHRPAVTKRAAVKQVLLKSLEDFTQEEFERFKYLLQFTYFQKGLLLIQWSQLDWAKSAGQLVRLMLENQQPMEVTKEVFMDMNRPDLVERLSETSSGLKEKVYQSGLLQKILETLEDLNYEELVKFKRLLQQTEMEKGFPRIPRHRMKKAEGGEVAELMVETYGQQSVEVTREVLEEMNRRDLVQRFSEITLGSEGPSGSLEAEGCGSTMQVSSDWTKLDPEVNSTDEAPTYSLQSEAGNFECSVSGLRWVCMEKVSLKFQFCSSKYHMEKIESIQYMPAGPLMDITVIAGKLDVVYLPHWICIDDNPTILDKFAVLHIDDCGVTVEKVSEVTSSHVKLCETTFSLKMVLVKLGFSVEINCKVFVYKTNRPFLKLHVYLIPPDPALKEELDKKRKSFGYEEIPMQHPKKPLKMNDWFILTAHLDGKEIASDTLQLIYESMEPNFYELYIQNPDKDLELQLKRENELPVWTRKILKEAYQSTSPVQASGEHFVDKHRVELIERVSNLSAILDDLLHKKVFQQGVYAEIRAIPTDEDKMRALYSGPLKAGEICKDIFYKILVKNVPLLIQELEK
ncbi:uncharacterized protein LOC131976321 isoform X2 [Centropristis striata]|uniref:uncharacterized protein LOC131976321 isoform X2 n=1 Tax=Centropristis striata TaxID=184440 RepID=UPI0027DF20E6|nr:uncharacterized protein LOC131976321 isoform X2 [Centropristis striata]